MTQADQLFYDNYIRNKRTRLEHINRELADNWAERRRGWWPETRPVGQTDDQEIR